MVGSLGMNGREEVVSRGGESPWNSAGSEGEEKAWRGVYFASLMVVEFWVRWMVKGKELAEQENWKIIQEEGVSLVAQR